MREAEFFTFKIFLLSQSRSLKCSLCPSPPVLVKHPWFLLLLPLHHLPQGDVQGVGVRGALQLEGSTYSREVAPEREGGGERRGGEEEG